MEADCNKCRATVSSKTLTCVVYIVLLSSTLVCVLMLHQEYEKYASFYSVSREAINKDDIPTATIWFFSKKAMRYGTDFTISTQHFIYLRKRKILSKTPVYINIHVYTGTTATIIDVCHFN